MRAKGRLELFKLTACYAHCYVPRTNKRPASLQAFVLNGAGTRSRTRDLLITSQLLYQLSYTGVLGRRL